MEPSIQRVIVFRLTLRAHDELVHRGLGAIVGNILNDREAGAAVGAVGERIGKATVLRGEDLPLAILAGSNVRRDQLAYAHLVAALSDDEIGVPFDRVVACFNRLDPCARRGLAPKRGEKIGEGVFIPLHLDLDATGRVADPSGQGSFVRQAVDKGPETDPLYHPAYADPSSPLHSTVRYPATEAKSTRKGPFRSDRGR